MKFTTAYDQEQEVELLEAVVDVDERDLMVYNDDYNTFDHVTNTLVRVCKHDTQQAEQCTWLIHFRGKCSVKKGSYEDLKPMCEGIREAGIDAKII